VDFFSNNAIWLGLAIGSAVALLWPMMKRTSGGVVDVSPAEAVQLINRENALVLDVRADSEFAEGHINAAKHIPLQQLPDRLKELAKFKDKPIVVNCQGGVRSTKACEVLRKNEFTKLYNLQGGINSWVKEKLPVVKG